MAHSIVRYVENGDSLSECYLNEYNRSDYIFSGEFEFSAL